MGLCREFLENQMEAKHTPGLSLAVIESAEVILHLDLGLKNSKKGDLIDKNKDSFIFFTAEVAERELEQLRKLQQ